MSTHAYNVPVFIGTGNVLTSGSTADLVAGQIGIFNAKTYNAASGVIGNDPLLIAAGSWHTKGQLNKFVGGLTQSDKTVEFLGKDIIEFHKSTPRKAQSEQWILGYDGLNGEGLDLVAGKNYHFRVKVWGEDVYGTFLRPVERFLTFKTGFAADPDAPEAVGSKIYAKELAATINNDPELKYFLHAEVISSDYAAKVATHNLYNLKVTDMGDQAALAAVQTAYPSDKVERISRVGLVSTYEVCRPIASGAPAAFTASGNIALAACDGTCPSGFTLAAAADVYIVSRPIGAADDLATVGAQNTFATAVAADYAGETKVTFLSRNQSVAVIELQFPVGTAVAAVKSDIVTKVATTEATCVPPAGAAAAWSDVGDRYKVTRKLTLSLEKECGTGNRLADIQAFYAADSSVKAGSIVVKTAGTCGDTYELEQYSSECSVDACLSDAQVSFRELQSFEGFTWTASEETNSDAAVLHGIRITAAYEDTRFGGCSFNPSDYYSVRPLKMEIFHFDDSGVAEKKLIPSRKTRNVSMPTQSGEWVVRQFINSNKYRAFGGFTYDKRLEEVLDMGMHNVVDTKKFYNLYFIKVRQNRTGLNSERDYAPELFEIMVAIPEDVDATNFENTIEKVSSQFGVFLKDR